MTADALQYVTQHAELLRTFTAHLLASTTPSPTTPVPSPVESPNYAWAFVFPLVGAFWAECLVRQVLKAAEERSENGAGGGGATSSGHIAHVRWAVDAVQLVSVVLALLGATVSIVAKHHGAPYFPVALALIGGSLCMAFASNVDPIAYHQFTQGHGSVMNRLVLKQPFSSKRVQRVGARILICASPITWLNTVVSTLAALAVAAWG